MTRRRTSLSDAPLLAWGDELRRRARQRRRLLRSLTLGIGCLPLAVTILVPPKPRLVWNASASAPIGLYAVTPGAAVERGDIVVARPPDPVRALAGRRHYLPVGVPLVKRIAAAPGDEVCAIGPRLFLNGEPLAERRRADAEGRPLPWWNGCLHLGPHRFLLLMTDAQMSFDGRYFGPSDARDLLGKATALWLR